MTAKEAKRYINLLGLEKGNNVVQATRVDTVVIEDDLLFEYTALLILKGAEDAFPNKDEAMLYVFRYDGQIQIFFENDDDIHGTRKLALDVVRKYTTKYTEEDSYMLMVETKPHTFTMVSQM